MNSNLSLDRREFLKTTGALVVGFSMFGVTNAQTLRAPKSVAKEAVDSWLTISPENRVTVYCGKVDLGTGSRTALAQLAAEELDVAFERVEMVMGDTATTPDQWLTAANLTIFQGGSELRRAAASARRALVERAAERLAVPSTELIVDDGVVRVKSNPAQALRYGELIGDGLNVEVDPKIALKKSSEYRLIGKSIRRVDIPGKVTGEFTYIHDVRVPGMLHARVIRSDLNEAHIDEVDLSEARKVHGYVQTVRKKNFLAVVARNEWAAIKAARAVRVYWRPGTPLPDQGGMFDYWRRLPVAKEEVTQTAGDAKSALESSTRRVKARYDFAVQTHATIGPSCAVADFKDGKLTVWTSSQATHSMGLDSAKEEMNDYEERFLARGLATLAFDGPGQGEAEYDFAICPEYEKPVKAVFDWLETRRDIDPGRAGIWGVSLGGYYAPRAAAFERRAKACVALSGPYARSDSFEGRPSINVETFRVRSKSATLEEAGKVALRMSLKGVAKKITCPIYIVAGTRDRLTPHTEAEKLAAEVSGPCVLSVIEGGNHVVNNLWYRYRDQTADWMADRLKG